jgi:pimeloyl-ACP methyl ester carboxylesterase
MSAIPTLPASWNAGDDETARPFTRLLFEAARLAYEPPDKGLPGFRHLGLEPEYIDRRSMQAYSANAGSDAIIAFRGTERSLGDVLTDLRIIRKHTSDGALHSGFWQGYDRIHTAAADVAAKAARRGGRVWLTGHSLGGALAVVAAYRLDDEKNLPIGGVVTFGQPMVVMPNLAQSLYPRIHDRYLRFVNGDDPIATLVRPYVHFGELALYREGAFQRENMSPGDPASKKLKGFARAGRPPLLPTRDDADLDAMIEHLEGERSTARDPDGIRSQGMIPLAQDHTLAAYSDLVRAFVEQGTV